MKISIVLFTFVLIASPSSAQYATFNKVCIDILLEPLTKGNSLKCSSPATLTEMPEIFKSFPSEMLSKQDENPGTYHNYSDFSDQLAKFTSLDQLSRVSACRWLFWNNGAMRRPSAGTLCAISKHQAFIKEMARKYRIPPEFLACTLGGDSMLYINEPDFIAKEKTGAARPSGEYLLDLVKPSAFDEKHPSFSFVGTTASEKLIEKMAVIGSEGRAKYLTAFSSRTDLEFGQGPEHEAAVLATIYNLGVDKLNPTGKTEPQLNYFGLSCLRMMRIYKVHLDHNPSADSCK